MGDASIGSVHDPIEQGAGRLGMAGIPQPKAGAVTKATGAHSAITGRAVNNRVAMTGELSMHGSVRAVGGVLAKVEAAQIAGADTVLGPAENWQQSFQAIPVRVVAVRRLQAVRELASMPMAQAPRVECAGARGHGRASSDRTRLLRAGDPVGHGAAPKRLDGPR